ncbi:RNA (C5-cytosine) methyltransferase, partial [Kipferlia bialata]|eukprot:g3213.t1
MGKRGFSRCKTQTPPEESSIYQYYKQILGDEDSKKWLEYMQKPLPIAFRMTTPSADPMTVWTRDELISRITACLDSCADLPDDFRDTLPQGQVGNDLPWPIDASMLQKVPFIQDGMAWMLHGLSRSHLRRVPQLKSLQSLLVLQMESGAINRQEAVSMLPPLFLGVKPGMRVLDMCAAPGSKTAQLLAAIHTQPEGTPKDTPVRGMVVANDVDLKRAYVLVHNVHRLKSPAMIVTNLDATKYPSPPDGVLYDRILADVPCSGDGTLRKAPDMWTRWKANNGHQLHNVQLKVAVRGAMLLKPGGRMVYSTCSLNPVENESVIATLLKLAKGALKVVTVDVPGVVGTPGYTTWPIYNPTNLEEECTPENRPKSVSATVFPPTKETEGEGVTYESVCDQLKKTIRICPWAMNSGGFYVCTLEKSATIPLPTDGVWKTSLDETAVYARQLQATPVEKLPKGVVAPGWHELPLLPSAPANQARLKNQWGFDTETAPYKMMNRSGDDAIQASSFACVTPEAASFLQGTVREGVTEEQAAKGAQISHHVVHA